MARVWGTEGKETLKPRTIQDSTMDGAEKVPQSGHPENVGSLGPSPVGLVVSASVHDGTSPRKLILRKVLLCD